MAKIKAKDLKRDKKLSDKEMKNTRGGAAPAGGTHSIIDPLFRRGGTNSIIDPLFKGGNKGIIDPLFKSGGGH